MLSDRWRDRRRRSVLTRIVCASAACASAAFAGTAAMAQRDRSAISQTDRSALLPWRSLSASRLLSAVREQVCRRPSNAASFSSASAVTARAGFESPPS